MHYQLLLPDAFPLPWFLDCNSARKALSTFHNVCRHHASLLASGSGQKSCFVCPYHGWTYGLDGTLLKANRISGIKNFKVHVRKFLLIKMRSPYQAGVFPFYVVVAHGLVLCLQVFCDNYLDGGYHVPYAHKGLASGLKLESYSSIVYEKVSIQKCDGDATESAPDFDRLGSKALYAFIYPNFMVNRYGPWMDTNLVVPLGPRKCQVIFDYFLDTSLKVDFLLISHYVGIYSTTDCGIL
ncbi:choline monooxygenase, chloroplastic-like [Coffea arabica]|uniref:Choline monooxygenase, chloroplastic n=1 Tax=Coffea arabica TaxID=13443 RepID=A0ABM4X7G4_COFAR